LFNIRQSEKFNYVRYLNLDADLVFDILKFNGFQFEILGRINWGQKNKISFPILAE